MSAWQQILALDAGYNNQRVQKDPRFRTLYIRRRSVLLRDGVKEQSDLRRQYVRIRSILLARQYGAPPDPGSTRSRSLSVQSHSRKHSDVESLKRSMQDNSATSASPALPPDHQQQNGYAFSGFLHVFDQHKKAVTCVKFANDELSLLAFGSLDGRISLCDLHSQQEVKVKHTLQGHSAGVTDLAWSASNDLLISVSSDASAKLWTAADGRSLRSVNAPQMSPLLCVIFHPINNNFVILGSAAGYVQVLNISTGHFSAGGSSPLGGAVTALGAPANGTLFWAGSAKGVLVSFQCDQASGKLLKFHRVCISEHSQISSISARRCLANHTENSPTSAQFLQARPVLSSGARPQPRGNASGLILLVNAANYGLLVFRVSDAEGRLHLRRRLSVQHSSKHRIRAAFCPIISYRQGTCVVSGSDDCSVYLLDVQRQIRPCLNRLQGHSAAVLDVSFNHDESLLASADESGTVIVWNRTG